MSKQQAQQLTALVLPTIGNENKTEQNIIRKYLFHWPLFLVCVIVFIGVAIFYNYITNPIYPISAALKFKTPTSASGAPIAINNNSLDQLDPVTTPVIVENEIEVMQSTKVIYQIVKDLQLWVTYTLKEGLKTSDLYGKSPVFFSFLDSNTNLDPKGNKIEITVKDEHSFLMKDTTGERRLFKFSEPIKSEFGAWKLDAKDNIKGYIGSTILLSIMDPDLASDDFQKRIKVELQDKDAPFVSVSFSDESISRGKDILNSLIAIYRTNAQMEKSAQTERILAYLTTKVDSIKRNLDQQELTIENYKDSEGITDVDKQADNDRNVIMLNNQAINTINVELSTLSSMESYINSSDNLQKLPPGRISVNTGDSSGRAITSIFDQLVTLQLQREQLLGTTPESNPLFAPIDRQIALLKADFAERIKSTRLQLEANKQQLIDFGTLTQTSLKKVPFHQREYNNLERERQKTDTTYSFLSTKKEEINLHLASVIQDSEIVDDAHASDKKWPRGIILFPLAFLMGIGAGVGILFARENMNDKIKSRRQIEEKTEVPILAELAYQDSGEAIVVTAGRSKFAIGEQFRVLRTNLYHLYGNNNTGRVTLFTSSVSGEGKSFVSSNLAVTLAYASRKTIILEMDLRKPKISVNFGLSSEHNGISNYLSVGSSNNIKEMIQPTGIPGLDVMSCGGIVPNPSELLETSALDELVGILRTMYDDVIIDTPPIHLVTDALIIARVADASLFVIRHDYTHKSELDFITEINASNRFNKFSIVFNGVKREATSYGYGYGYYNNYNYYNSYTEKPKWNFWAGIKGFLKRF